MPRKDRRHSIDRSGFPTSGTMNKTMRPARYVRGGEALSVASRGEHGHHPVITLPMNRFCPDRKRTPFEAWPELELDYISCAVARRLKLTLNPNPILHRRYECEPLSHPPPDPPLCFRLG